MPPQFRSVLDGLEDVWGATEAGWRRANARRQEADALQARTNREASRAVAGGVRRAASVAKGKADAAALQVRGSTAVAVVDALFGERVNAEPQTGPIDYEEVDDRIRKTRRVVEVARASGDLRATLAGSAAAGIQWLSRVKSGGAWDDKKRLPDGERQGNFSFGATAQALGLPLELAQRGAGAYQRRQAVEDAVGGKRGRQVRARQGFLEPPYGDEVRDQASIAEGYEYGRRRGR